MRDDLNLYHKQSEHIHAEFEFFRVHAEDVIKRVDCINDVLVRDEEEKNIPN